MKQTTPTQTDKLFLFVIQHDFEENEILKEIPDTDGKYFISNSGYVLSLCRKKPLILKPYDCGNGYSFVKINGKNKRIHRLVGNAFINNTDNKPIIHHKDNNKQNNSINNLQWATAKENSIEYQKHKRTLSSYE